jgi:hypothetical protein
VLEFYLNARREEMQAGLRELLNQLNGSRAARVALLAGMTPEELEAVGGVQEDDYRWPSALRRATFASGWPYLNSPAIRQRKLCSR